MILYLPKRSWQYIRLQVFVRGRKGHRDLKKKEEEEEETAPSCLLPCLPTAWISSVLQPPSSDPLLHHGLSVPVRSPSNTPSRQRRSPGDVSLLRSDVVGRANRPSRPLLLTRPSFPFLKAYRNTARKHKHTQKSRKKTEPRQNACARGGPLAQFLTADKQTLYVFLC